MPTTLTENDLTTGDQLISPNKKRWIVEAVNTDVFPPEILVRSESGRPRTMYPRELANWNRLTPENPSLNIHTQYAPSGHGSVITVTGTTDEQTARTAAGTELRIIYTEAGKTPVIAVGDSAVHFAPTDDDAAWAVKAKATRLNVYWEPAPSGSGSVISVTGTGDEDAARAAARVELRMLYSDAGQTPVVAVGGDAVHFAPTDDDAAWAAMYAPTRRSDW